MVKRLATSPHDPLGITDSACKNQLVMVSVQYGPFNTYIPIRSTTIGTSRVARDLITMHTSRRSNSDIACVTRVSMTFRVVRTNQYNQDLGLIHSTNGNHLESSNEGSSIDHQVTIHLHAQNITMFPTNETWYFTSQMLVSSSGGLILILMAQSTRNEFRIHNYGDICSDDIVGHGRRDGDQDHRRLIKSTIITNMTIVDVPRTFTLIRKLLPTISILKRWVRWDKSLCRPELQKLFQRDFDRVRKWFNAGRFPLAVFSS
ncbi:putative rhamnogalacturonate lyase B [Dorcoceras hygrometricum]|uniref:Putative rhamnogalacturonate lyase B n=1 Tax=Dorcoceras hygrometricum TaxID=472368 RepID=A0A2Z7CRU8_9LAMI|nr:putative rhamnogalacturonate lyase B [Dorcoceras hygrometricum]